MRLRGSANAFALRAANAREASAIAGSISIVSTRSIVVAASIVCVVSPVPMPMIATRFASGLCASGTAAVSTIVTSSEIRAPSSRLIAPSDLPLVRKDNPSRNCSSATEVVLPSR